MKYLLDTCVISELVAKRPDSRVTAWIDSIDSENAFLTTAASSLAMKTISSIPALLC